MYYAEITKPLGVGFIRPSLYPTDNRYVFQTFSKVNQLNYLPG